MCTEMRKSQPHTMSPVETKTELQTELGSSKVALKGTIDRQLYLKLFSSLILATQCLSLGPKT